MCLTGIVVVETGMDRLLLEVCKPAGHNAIVLALITLV